MLKALPDAKEKFSYDVPYFYGKRRICFIWPASKQYGPKSGVNLGFCYANRMDDPDDILEKGSRAQVYIINFQKVSEIKVKQIQKYLLEAKLVDLQH